LKSKSFWIAMHAAVILGVLAAMSWISANNYASMSSNPTQFVQRTTGLSALYSLLLTLAITPLRQITGWIWIVRFRRTLGLLSFFLATLHLGSFLILDHGFDVSEISVDIVKRPFIVVGIVTFILLTPLAVTSTARTKKWLGANRWKKLHRLIYPASALAITHYYSLKKVDLTDPLTCAAVLVWLLGWRVLKKWKNQQTIDNFGRNKRD
jgi:methionine sulfoxide reductase heme-binding subunit